MPRQQAALSRPRPPRSCHNCSRRKVACDKVKPRCGRCSRTGLQCVYAGSGASSRNSITIIDETPTIAGQQRELSTRLNRLGRMISATQVPQTDSGNGGDDSSGGDTNLYSSGYEASASNTYMPSATSLAQTGQQGDADDKFEDPGHLFVAPQSRSRYVSPVHFAMISREVSEINELLRNQQRYSLNQDDDYDSEDNTELPDPTAQLRNDLEDMRLYGDIFPHVPAWSSRDVHVGQFARNSKLHEIIRGIPSQAQCVALIRAYLAGYHSVSPLFHSPTFWQDVRNFFQKIQVPSTDHHISFHFLALFTAVLFAGSVVCPRSLLRTSFGEISREDLSTRLYKRAVRAIRLSDFPRSPSVQSLTAYIIVDATWLRAEQPLSCCPFVAVAARVAQMLGLHKEPSKFPDMDPIEVHVRRQIWWSLVALDAQIALASGLPCIIETSFYDVQPVSELAESAISCAPTEGAATIKEILRIFIGGKFEFYRLTGRFMRLLNNNIMNEQDLCEILEIIRTIQADLYSRRERVSLVMQTATANGGAPEGAPVLSKLTKIVLSMLAAKPYAVMYGPVRRHGLLDKLREKEPTHMMYCREYLHRFLRVTQCHHFQPWHWCWPGQHQPLYSVMALIQDLEDHPFDPLANETRRLIDLAIDMCGPEANGGIVSLEDGDPVMRPLHEGGAEAWTFVRRARERAWEKAGLDPSRLNCPESAKQIHFDGFPGQFDDIALPNDDVHHDNWLGPFPQLGEDWMSFFADVPVDWDFES